MATSPTPTLPDDHIDLLVSAAARWHILTSRTTAAFTEGVAENHVLAAAATRAGQLIRTENTAAIEWLSAKGRTRLVDRAHAEDYTHSLVEHLAPVEVIKAAHATEASCAARPTWQNSAAQRLVSAVLTCATHRLEGYADAPWIWTRPRLRSGRPIGIAAGATPHLPDLEWIDPADTTQLRQHWATASVVVITCAATAMLPVDLPQRPGLFMLAGDESSNEVWQSLTALAMPALVLFWPMCQDWLLTQLTDPEPEFVEHRSQP